MKIPPGSALWGFLILLTLTLLFTLPVIFSPSTEEPEMRPEDRFQLKVVPQDPLPADTLGKRTKDGERRDEHRKGRKSSGKKPKRGKEKNGDRDKRLRPLPGTPLDDIY